MINSKFKYGNKGENFIKLTAAKVINKNKFKESDYSDNAKAAESIKKFNSLSFDDKIDIIYNIIILQEEVIKEYLLNFKNFHLVGIGSFRELKDRRYCLSRTKELKANFPDITGEEIYKILRREIKQKRIKEKMLRKNKNL
jgi:hypothetical protein